MSSSKEVPEITEVTKTVVNGVCSPVEPLTSLANSVSTPACTQPGSSEVDGTLKKDVVSIENAIQLSSSVTKTSESSRPSPSQHHDCKTSFTNVKISKPEQITNDCTLTSDRNSTASNCSSDDKKSTSKSASCSNKSTTVCCSREGTSSSSDVCSSIPVSSITILSPDDPVVLQAYALANFIIDSITHSQTVKSCGKVEETLLKNVNHLIAKHSITFRGMMKRLDINKDTGYITFVTVANELFENEKKNITWSRIIALYAFGAQLALHCKEKGFVEYASHIGAFMGKYVADTAGPFVKQQGGWERLIEEFPSEDQLGDTMWKLFAWSAMGLGLATATMIFASKR